MCKAYMFYVSSRNRIPMRLSCHGSGAYAAEEDDSTYFGVTARSLEWITTPILVSRETPAVLPCPVTCWTHGYWKKRRRDQEMGSKVNSEGTSSSASLSSTHVISLLHLECYNFGYCSISNSITGGALMMGLVEPNMRNSTRLAPQYTLKQQARLSPSYDLRTLAR